MRRHAMVLAAGLGTRLRPLTDVRAKAAMPLAGEPVIRRIIAGLADQQVTTIVVNLHHRPDTITRQLGDGRDLGVDIRYSWEGTALLGSAGGPRVALPLLDSAPFVLVNGDTLTDVDLEALRSAHASSGALVTMALVPNLDPMRYGGVHIDAQGHVTGFVPRGVSAIGSLHFTGVQMAAPEAFHAVPVGSPAATVGGLYEQLIAARSGSIHGWISAARSLDIGTVADYWRTSQKLAADADDFGRGRGTQVHPKAHVRRSILWDDVAVDRGAWLEDCIVTDGVKVHAGTRAQRSILLHRGGALVTVSFDEAGVPREPAPDRQGPGSQL